MLIAHASVIEISIFSLEEVLVKFSKIYTRNSYGCDITTCIPGPRCTNWNFCKFYKLLFNAHIRYTNYFVFYFPYNIYLKKKILILNLLHKKCNIS